MATRKTIVQKGTVLEEDDVFGAACGPLHKSVLHMDKHVKNLPCT